MAGKTERTSCPAGEVLINGKCYRLSATLSATYTKGADCNDKRRTRIPIKITPELRRLINGSIKNR